MTELLDTAKKEGLLAPAQARLVAAAGGSAKKVTTTLAEIKAVFMQPRTTAVDAEIVHELAHHRQHLLEGLNNLNTFEMEYQAFVAEQEFLRQLPIEQVPEDFKWLLSADRATILRQIVEDPTYIKLADNLPERWGSLDDCADWILENIREVR